jgi:hypothetical protein
VFINSLLGPLYLHDKPSYDSNTFVIGRWYCSHFIFVYRNYFLRKICRLGNVTQSYIMWCIPNTLHFIHCHYFNVITVKCDIYISGSKRAVMSVFMVKFNNNDTYLWKFLSRRLILLRSFSMVVKFLFFVTQFLYHYKAADLQCRRWWNILYRETAVDTP